MPKIHFVCLFGVEYDLDLAPWWVPYYRNMRLDTYTVYLHRERGPVGDHHVRWFEEQGFTVHPVSGPHGDGMLRRLCIERHIMSLPEGDLLVTADADEFQSVSTEKDDGAVEIDGIRYCTGTRKPEPPDYRYLEKHYDIISGYMLDRYTFAMTACDRDPFDQYLFQEERNFTILKTFTPPYFDSSKWPATRRTKILAARCGYKTAFEGSHLMLEAPAAARMTGNFDVVHFAWREGAKRKVAMKGYYSQDILSEVFGGKPPQELVCALDRMKPGRILCP